MTDPRKEFETALLVNRVASRFAMEFDTDEALRDYLKEHPGADRSQHSVKKQAPKSKDKDESKDKDDGSKKDSPKGGGKRPAMKGKSMGPAKPISDWKPADYEQFMKEFTYKDVRPLGEIFKNKADIDALEAGMPKKLQKNFNYYKGVREKRWDELKNTDEGKKLRTKDKPEPKPEKSDSKPEAKSEKSDSKPKKTGPDPFAAGGKFDSDNKPSSKEYVAAVEDALVSKNKWGWKDPGEVKEFMGKFHKLDDSSKRELAWRLIEEEHTPESLASEFFKKK